MFFKNHINKFGGKSNSQENLNMPPRSRSPSELTSQGKCHFMKTKWLARKQHAQLMLNLIQRCYGRSKFQDVNF